jgi:hypothetical protein
VLLNSRQLAEERLARQQILERRGLGSKGVGEVRLVPQKWPRGAERLPRPVEISKPRLRQCLLQLRGALDRIFDRSVRRVKRGDGVVLGPPDGRLHLAKGAVENGSAGQAVGDDQPQRARDGCLRGAQPPRAAPRRSPQR